MKYSTDTTIFIAIIEVLSKAGSGIPNNETLIYLRANATSRICLVLAHFVGLGHFH